MGSGLDANPGSWHPACKAFSHRESEFATAPLRAFRSLPKSAFRG
jgi:hypothetical protein